MKMHCQIFRSRTSDPGYRVTWRLRSVRSTCSCM